MAIEWRESLATGVEEIDLQHKELFARFSNLLESCNKGSGREEVLNLLLFLDSYIKTHFAAEEKLQIKHNYPGYGSHREQHRLFIAEVDRLEREFRNEGSTLSLVVRTNRAMVEWLIQHIGKVDREFAVFLRGE